MSRLFLFGVFCFLSFSFGPSIQARGQLDTSKINGKIKTVKSLIDSRDFHTAQQLSHEIINNSQESNYLSGIAWGKYYLADAYFGLSGVDSALFWMQEAIRGFIYTQDFESQISAYNRMGNYLLRTDSNDSSSLYFNKAITIATEINDSVGLANAQHGLGKAMAQMGLYAESMDLYTQALAIRERLNDDIGIASVLNNIGIIFWYQGDFSNALDFFFRSLHLHSEANDLQGLAYQYNNIGLVYRDIKDYTKSVENLKKSWAIKIQINDRRGISNSLMNIGSVFLQQDKLDSALIYLDQSSLIKEQIKDRGGLAAINRYKGEVYRKLKLYHKSIEFLSMSQNSYKVLNKPKGIAEATVQLGITYFEIGQHTKALALMDEAISIVSNTQLLELKDLIYHTLYEFYDNLGNCEKSLFYYKHYVAIHDSIMGQNILKNLLTIQLKSEHDAIIQKYSLQKDSELEQVEKEKRSKTRLAYFFMVAFLLSLITSALFLYTLRKKQLFNDKLGLQQLEVERQKQELIEQRDELEIQKNLVIYQRDRIINMLTDLGESIDYAKKIQQAILPTPQMLQQYFADYFTIYQPKESVGGDFYWVGNCGNKIGFAAADCTGHGVPGGFMSMLGISMINDMITRESVHTPATILAALRQNIINALGQKGREDDSYDGMDIALCTYDRETHILTYAGANLPILINTDSPVEPSERIAVHFDGLVELKPDRMPVSYFDKMDAFHEVQYRLNPGDTIYMFSDGFMDQFGGEMSKKFGHTAFRSLIHSLKGLPMNQQKQVVWTSLDKWKGETENQTDDILVLGLRLT
ncbi:MAG: tetratricopeptide repeat protein [Bacteroidales bacterium]|nr:tetratricopeptide repeat protein [Bacteroidales bacterium]